MNPPDSSPGPFESAVQRLYEEMGLDDALPEEVFRLAMIGHYNLKGEGVLATDTIITIIDYTKPSVEERFYVINLKQRKVVLTSLDSHGKNSGHNLTESFSNRPGSLKSTLGFFVTGETYIIRQGPGPTNALGLVKFIFPNKHFVFLHDTPSNSLFDRESRTFSSGCIRVENPFELARTLLNDPQKWSRAEIDKVVKSEKTRTVYLNRPMPVVILYWTAYVDEHGQVHFMDDVYERDNRVLKDLNAGFRIRERELKGRR